MKKIIVIISALLMPILFGCSGKKAAPQDGTYTYSVQKIWDKGTHAAFTSLIEFNGKYYCSFREGYWFSSEDHFTATGSCYPSRGT